LYIKKNILVFFGSQCSSSVVIWTMLPDANKWMDWWIIYTNGHLDCYRLPLCLTHSRPVPWMTNAHQPRIHVSRTFTLYKP